MKFVNDGSDRMMLIGNGAQRSIVSSKWFDGYLQDAKVSEKEVKKKACARKFRMGKTVYLSDTEITFPIVLKTDDRDYVKRNVRVSLINADEINFLCGKKTKNGWKTKDDLEDDKWEFKGYNKVIELTESDGGHQLAKLETASRGDDNEAVYNVPEEEDAVVNENSALCIQECWKVDTKGKEVDR